MRRVIRANTHLKYMPLIARLLALVLVSVLPSIAVLLYNGYDLRQRREEGLRDEALLYARAAADELARVSEGAHAILLTIAHAPPVRTADWPNCDRYLAELNNASPAYIRLAVADRTGRIVCASTTALAELSLADRPHFQDALAREEFIVGPYIIGRRSGVALLPFAAPWRDTNGQVGGVVVIGLKLDWLVQRVEQKARPPDGTLLIADRNGTILARSPNPEQWTGYPIDDDMRRYFAAAGPGTAETVGVDGVRRVYGYIPPAASGSGLYVAAAVGTESALKPIGAASDRGVALVVFAGLVALIATWLVGDRLIRRPVRRLIAAARELGIGNYRCALPSSGSTEFGALNHALIGAADQLAAREAALRASEARFQRLADLTQEGVVIHDGERVVEVNAAAARLFGFAPDEMIGRPAIEFIAPEARAEAAANVRAGLEQPYESVGLRKDGSRFPVEVYGRSIECDGRPMRVITIRDLTARMLTEEALRRAEQRYRLAVRAANDLIWDWDIESDRLEFSEEIQTQFGYAPDEINATFQWWSDRIHPDERAHIIESVQAALGGAAESWSSEYRFLRADGAWANVLDRGLIVRAPDGRAIRMIGSVLDLTERKRAEAALRHAADQNRALLREANHRIKNNLQLVSSLLGLQRRAVAEPDAQRALDEARRRIQTIARVHQGFYSSGAFANADFGDVLRAVCESFVGKGDQPNVVVDVPAACSIPAATATPLALIANELVTNALKHAFTPGQPGSVIVRYAPAPDDGGILTVADNGRGLPSGFDPARQGGFGLRLVITLARQIGAEVRIRSAEPGAAIDVRVPPPRRS